jgi:hypothetical protein
MVLALAKDITEFKSIQQITDLTEMPAEEYLLERLPAGKLWHVKHLAHILSKTDFRTV